MYKPIRLAKKTIALDKTAEWRKCMEYAVKHNDDVMYTDLKNADSFKVMYNFQKQWFEIDLSEIEVNKTDGTIEKIINCRFKIN